jgi:hypothetical protein
MKSVPSDKAPLIATKYAPQPWRFTADTVPAACKASLKRLQLDKVGFSFGGKRPGCGGGGGHKGAYHHTCPPQSRPAPRIPTPSLAPTLFPTPKPQMALYIQHWPGFFLNAWSNDAYLEGLARCVEQGLTTAVGVSNFNEQRWAGRGAAAWGRWRHGWRRGCVAPLAACFGRAAAGADGAAAAPSRPRPNLRRAAACATRPRCSRGAAPC